MPRKIRNFVCEACGREFQSRSKSPKSCSIICRTKLSGKIYHETIEKECLQCSKKFKTQIGRNEKKFCSHKCSTNWRNGKTLDEIGWSKKAIKKNDDRLKSEEFNKHKSKLFLGKTLKERGWSDKAIERDKQIKIERNLSNKGKNLEEIYGKKKAGILIENMSRTRGGDGNPMSYKNVMKRLGTDDPNEAKKHMPATGRCGGNHPFFGKHHSVESKKKMMKTFEENEQNYNFSCGYFDGVYWQGSWELKFIIDNIEIGNKVKRYDLDPLEYVYKDKPYHYFPDFILNGTKVVEIKGVSFREKTKEKEDVGRRIFGSDFVWITNIAVNRSAKTFYRLMKEKYKDRLDIVYDVYKDKK